MVPAAAADGQVALAITDLCNLFGAVKFYSACARRASSRSSASRCAWSAARRREGVPTRLVLLVQNRHGYLNLCDLLSRGWTKNAASGAGLDAMGLARRAAAAA